MPGVLTRTGRFGEGRAVRAAEIPVLAQARDTKEAGNTRAGPGLSPGAAAGLRPLASPFVEMNTPSNTATPASHHPLPPANTQKEGRSRAGSRCPLTVPESDDAGFASLRQQAHVV